MAGPGHFRESVHSSHWHRTGTDPEDREALYLLATVCMLDRWIEGVMHVGVFVCLCMILHIIACREASTEGGSKYVSK